MTVDPTTLSDQDLVNLYDRLLPAAIANIEDIDPTFRYELQRLKALREEVEFRGYEREFQKSGPPIWKSEHSDRPDIIAEPNGSVGLNGARLRPHHLIHAIASRASSQKVPSPPLKL